METCEMTTLAAHETTYVHRTAPRNASASVFAQDSASAASSIFPANDQPTICVSHYMRIKRAGYYAAVHREAKSAPSRANREGGNPLFSFRSLVASAGLLMPFDASDELMTTAADTVPHFVPLAQAKPVESVGEASDELDSRSWRGILAIEHPKEVLFRKRIDICPDKLREWKPNLITTRRRLDDDDE